MALFLAIAACLVLATLGPVLRPLWRVRPLPAFALALVVAIACGVLYRAVGTPAALDAAAVTPPATMDDAIARLEDSLRRDPAQPDGLRLLARAYREQGDMTKARDRLMRAVALLPDDADLLVETAETRALADPARKFDTESVALLRRALAVQPMHQRGRWFLGIALRQQGQDAEAAKTWEPLLAVIDAPTAAALRPQIDAARADAGLAPLPASAPSSRAQGLSVRVALSPALAGDAARAGASVFVIARSPGGPPMPVAVEKHPVSALPLTVVLDDGDGPMPTQKLSALREVEVVARLSASGNAMRQDGDLESAPVRIALPARAPVELVIGAPR